MADETELLAKPEKTEDGRMNPQVGMWADRVKKAKGVHKEAFKRMREDMRFARGLQWPGQEDLQDKRYVANMVQRHLRQRESALYAKNPTAVAHRRSTLDFAMWDGDPEALMQAQQTLVMAQDIAQQAAAAGDVRAATQATLEMQEAQQLLQDYQEGMRRRNMLDKMAKTLEIVWDHQTGEQQPPFKKSMKQLVRRTLTTGCGYLKLGYHRFREYGPADTAKVNDFSEQIRALEAQLATLQDEDKDPPEEDSVALAELQDAMRKVQEDAEAFIREGLDLNFPKSTAIIPDPACYQLDGFVGARWVAEEFLLTPKEVREVYGKDIEKAFTAHMASGEEFKQEDLVRFEEDGKEPDQRALVWEIWDKHLGQMFTVCLGHPEFLEEPQTPKVYLERFWPWFALTFNGLEDEEELFPPSDVRLMRDMQQEHNLMRQRLREHRDAARPGYVSPRGRLEDGDKQALENRKAHQVVELNGLQEQDDIRRILQPIPSNPIDPNQYEVGSLQDDIYKVVGTQEAVLGGASGATATETSIAESSRLSAIGNAVDELDDFLTEVAKSSSHLLLSEMSRDTALEIAGRGGVWPELSGAEVAKDLWLEIRAGSSGRPNKAAEIQNFERLAPILLQIPGMKPKKLAEMAVERLDDRLDVDDLFDPSLPAMTAMNRQAQPSMGGPEEDPNQQGGEGGDQTAVEQGDSNMGPRVPAESRNMDPNRG